MFTKQLFLGIAVISIAVSAQANSNNPFDPRYYWHKCPVAKVAMNGGKVYVDDRNPTHPSYAHAKVDWIPTVMMGGTAYVDSRNQLHPSFT